MHQQYLRGEAIDHNSISSKHRLAPLQDLQISMTAVPIAPPELRSSLIETLVNNGATYRASFSESTTHLLIGPDVNESNIWSNAKVQKARELQARGLTTLFVIWQEWLEDSLKMGGALEESNYIITNPRPKDDRKVGSLPCARSPSIVVKPSHSFCHASTTYDAQSS